MKLNTALKGFFVGLLAMIVSFAVSLGCDLQPVGAQTMASMPGMAGSMPMTVSGVVTGVVIKPGYSGAQVSCSAYPGAADYGIRRVDADGSYADNEVKYTGEAITVDANPGPDWEGTTAATTVDVNGVYGAMNGQYWVIEAYDAQGPSAWRDLTSYLCNGPTWSDSNPPPGIINPPPQMAMSDFAGSYVPSFDAMGNLSGYVSPGYVWGSNEGTTLDGLFSTNGQGPYTDTPHVIARSARFTITSTGQSVIPSGPDVLKYWTDHFTTPGTFSLPTIVSETNQNTAVAQTNTGCENFSYTDSSGVIHFFVQEADTRNSRTLVMHGHVMSVLFDGGMAGVGGNSEPQHNNHAYWAMSPATGFDMSDGNIFDAYIEEDMMMEVGRRNVEIFIYPFKDPLWQFDENLNTVAGLPLPLNNTSCIEITYSTNNFGAELWNTVNGVRVKVPISPWNTRVNQPQIDLKIPERIAVCGAIKCYIGATTAGSTTCTITNSGYLNAGDTLLIDSGATQETATILSSTNGTVTFGTPLKFNHIANTGALCTSEGHLQMYENGVLVIDANIAGGIPWCNTVMASDETAVNFAQVKYHSSLDDSENSIYKPYNNYWIGIPPTNLAGVMAVAVHGTVTVTASNYKFSAADVNQTLAVPGLGFFTVLSAANGGAVIGNNNTLLIPGQVYTGIIGASTPAQWTLGMPESGELHIANPGAEVFACGPTSWATIGARFAPTLVATSPVLQVPKTVTGLIAFITPGKSGTAWTLRVGTVTLSVSEPALIGTLSTDYAGAKAASVTYATSGTVNVVSGVK